MTRDDDDTSVPRDVSDAELAEQESTTRALFANLSSGPPDASPSLLPGVQRKLRERSAGKFFGDRWSTSQPSMTYSVVAGIMLMILAVTYFALAPAGLP